MRNLKGSQRLGNRQNRTRRRSRGIRWEGYAVVFGMALVVGALVRAQSFGVPYASAPNNTAALNVPTDPGDFISVASGNAQVNSSLVIASSTSPGAATPPSAIIGDFERRAGLSGFAGITTEPLVPPALPGTVPGTAVYGYAKGSPLSVGAYGYAVGTLGNNDSAAGVFATARLDENGLAPLNTILTAPVGGLVQYTLSIAIGADNLPIIGYYEASSGKLMTLKCGNLTCSGGNVTATVDSGSVRSIDIAIGTDNMPIISYFVEAANTLKIAHCGLPDCSDTDPGSPTGNKITTADNIGNGGFVSLMIGSDDNMITPEKLPIVSYFGGQNSDLKVLHCGKADCSDTDPGSLTGNEIMTIESAGLTGKYTSIAQSKDPAPVPVISYYDISNGNLKFVKCTTVDCSGVQTPLTLDAGNPVTDDVGWFTSVAVLADNKPIISYYNNTTKDLNVLKCGQADCNGSGPTANIITTLDTGGDVGSKTSIIIGSDGFPVISYYDATNFDLKIAKCMKADCSTGTLMRRMDGAATKVGVYTSIALGADTMPVVSYITNEDGAETNKYALKVAHCGNIFCQPGGYAGLFSGPVKVTSGSLPGSLLIGGALSVPSASFTSISASTPGLWSTNGTRIDGAFSEGLTGQTLGEYGIYGESAQTTGFRSVNVSDTVAEAQTRIGIKGTSGGSTNFAGVYGSVLQGNGVAGISGTGAQNWSVYGEATQSAAGAGGLGSSGVYGRGGVFAGYFEGDLTIGTGGTFYLGSSGITKSQLIQLLEWCKGPPSFCPDPYQ